MEETSYIVTKLGIQDYPERQQEEILVQVRTFIGEKISETLTEAQLAEYEAIINADNQVIQRWLAENVPRYKETLLYQELEAGVDEDPEHNDPAKIFANLAWVQKNVPNKQEIIDQVVDEYKATHLATS